MTPCTSRPRLLHPAAWWCWALCVGVAASRTTNPWLLGLLAALLGWTVAQRREPGTGRILAAFLLMGALAIVLRVGATALGGARLGAHLLVELPVVPRPPGWAACGSGGRWDPSHCCGLCTTARNSPSSWARSARRTRWPGRVACCGTCPRPCTTWAPRSSSASPTHHGSSRRRSAWRGRGACGGTGAEGSGRRVASSSRSCPPRWTGRSAWPRRWSAAATAVRSRPWQRQLLASGLAMLGLGGVVVGVYGLLDGFTPVAVGLPVLVLGILVAAATLWFGAGRDPRTRYRRDPFARPEWVTIACGVTVAVAFGGWGALDPTGMRPPTMPSTVPDLPLVPVLALVVVALPGALTPEPPVESAASSVPAAPARGADDGDLTPHALAPALARGRAADRARGRRSRSRRRSGSRRRPKPPASTDRRSARPEARAVIDIQDLEIRFADASAPALRCPRLHAPEGEMILVCGPTGSGKSTLLGSLIGLVLHFTGGRLRGRVRVAGRDTREHRPRAQPPFNQQRRPRPGITLSDSANRCRIRPGSCSSGCCSSCRLKARTAARVIASRHSP